MRTFVYPLLFVLYHSARLAAGELAALAPLVTDDVSTVVYVNLEKVDLPSIAEELINLSLVPQSQVAEVKQQAAAMQSVFAQLPKAGARRAYLLVRASDFFHGPTLVVEVAEDSQAQAVADLLAMWMKDVAGDVAAYLPDELAVEGALVIGASSAERLKEISARRTDKPREDAIRAIGSITTSDVGIVAFGDKDSRRVIREMFPQLPAPFMEIDGKLLADGLKWLAVTVKLPPEPAVAIALEAVDTATATVFETAAEKAITLAKGFLAAELVSGPPAHQQRAQAILPLLSMLEPRQEHARLTITFGDDERELAFLRDFLPAITQRARDSASRAQRMNNFKQLALAMLNYESAKGTFPPAESYDDKGRPLLSWRVHVLPYLGEQALYQQFKLDEPWDSEHNRKLIEKMPGVFADPDSAVQAAIGEEGRTTYVVPTGEGLIFGAKEAMMFRDVRDGTSNTILIVEVPPGKAVVWTKPEDWEVNLENPIEGLKRTERDWFTTAFCDGSARILSTKNEPTVLRALLTPAGEEVVDHNALK